VGRSFKFFEFCAFALAAAGALACNGPPSAESLPEWTPRDHHSADDEKLAMQQGQAPAQRGQATDIAQLVDLTWRQQCSGCHGASGRGDGQMGPMLQVRDLTAADWQSQVTNEQIAVTIKNGKNKMPKFDLPDPVIQGLVQRIRTLDGRSPASPEPGRNLKGQ
jgi:cytochrome c oxidase cbb3-type subunit 3